MYFASLKTFDTSDGEGIRTSLFVSGCHYHCKGCFNQIAWRSTFGSPYTKETEDVIVRSLAPSYVDGLSLLGGEPFEPYNAPTLAALCRRVKALYPNKTIWAWTGGLFEDLIKDRISLDLLQEIDVLVDGPFVIEKRDLSLKYCGSTNQRVIDVKASLAAPGRKVVPYHDEGL